MTANPSLDEAMNDLSKAVALVLKTGGIDAAAARDLAFHAMVVLSLLQDSDALADTRSTVALVEELQRRGYDDDAELQDVLRIAERRGADPVDPANRRET